MVIKKQPSLDAYGWTAALEPLMMLDQVTAIGE
jgi:hypothetical protein